MTASRPLGHTAFSLNPTAAGPAGCEGAGLCCHESRCNLSARRLRWGGSFTMSSGSPMIYPRWLLKGWSWNWQRRRQGACVFPPSNGPPGSAAHARCSALRFMSLLRSRASRGRSVSILSRLPGRFAGITAARWANIFASCGSITFAPGCYVRTIPWLRLPTPPAFLTRPISAKPSSVPWACPQLSSVASAVLINSGQATLILGKTGQPHQPKLGRVWRGGRRR